MTHNNQAILVFCTFFKHLHS